MYFFGCWWEDICSLNYTKLVVLTVTVVPRSDYSVQVLQLSMETQIWHSRG